MCCTHVQFCVAAAWSSSSISSWSCTWFCYQFSGESIEEGDVFCFCFLDVNCLMLKVLWEDIMRIRGNCVPRWQKKQKSALCFKKGPEDCAILRFHKTSLCSLNERRTGIRTSFSPLQQRKVLVIPPAVGVALPALCTYPQDKPLQNNHSSLYLACVLINWCYYMNFLLDLRINCQHDAPQTTNTLVCLS